MSIGKKLVFVLIFVQFENGNAILEYLFSAKNKNFSGNSIGLLSKRQAKLIQHKTETVAFMEFGEECETNGRYCNENKFLECIDGKCLCHNPLKHAFDENIQQCVGLSSSQCGSQKPPCVKNSQCLFGSCQCIQGYGETSTNVCMKNKQEPCRPNECNGDQLLACIKGTCQCVDSSLVYDPFSKKCLNPQTEFDKFARTVGRDVVQRVIARTVSDATSLVFLPLRFLVPGFG